MKNEWLSRSKKNKCEWDFNIALGETIKKKYNSPYVKVIEVSNLFNRDLKKVKLNEK